eukprot:Tamp_19491.p1 GENE.Tamp_19491~~Tamp_19491.p1  ORF type:complete len:351 (+),score=13.51 Tamp_19491:103-1155(+)
MDILVLCVVLCLLSTTSAMAVWSLSQFWAQTSRRAQRRARRRKEDMKVARRERERCAPSERAASRTPVYEASQPPTVCAGGDAESPARGLLARRLCASDVGPATGNEKPGRLVKWRSAPLEERGRSETHALGAEPRMHSMPPRSSSLDQATAAIARDRPAKARDTRVHAAATAPGPSSTDRSETHALGAEPRMHSMPRSSSLDQATAAIARDRPAKARDTRVHAAATAPGPSSTDRSETHALGAEPRRRSMPRSSSFDQAIAHDRAAEATLPAAGGPPVTGSTSVRSNFAPGGPPPISLPRSTSFERMIANDRNCPPTPGIPSSPHAQRPVSSSGSRFYANIIRRRLTDY